MNEAKFQRDLKKVGKGANHREEKTNPESPRRKFQSALTALDAALVERTDEAKLALIGMIARNNPLFVGPPGSGKTMLLDTLTDWVVGAIKFSYLLTKYTDPMELFGPIDLPALKAGENKRVVDGYIPTASLVYLDEVFKASSAILNTTLKVMNEHTFVYGRQVIHCPTIMFMGSSNEYPNEQEELGALFDRFLLRKTVRYVSKSGRRELLRKAVANDACKAKFPERITTAEIDLAHQEAIRLPWSDQAKKSLWEITTLLDREGIGYGDRRLMQSVNVCRAAAYLDGADEVKTEHLDVLQYVLWDAPGEPATKCARIVGKIANPAGMVIAERLQQADDVMDKAATHDEAVNKLNAILAELRLLPADPRRDKALVQVEAMTRERYFHVIGLKVGGESNG